MLQMITAGESHGPALTAILSGMPAGIPLDEAFIAGELARRQIAIGAGGRMKIEKDRATILGGVMEGRTTGAPIALQILNADFAHWKGREVPAYTTPRPGHVDLSAVLKYGLNDIRPALERASARETATRVAIGAICKTYLAAFGISIHGAVIQIGKAKVQDREAALDRLLQGDPPKLTPAMEEEIAKAKEAGETVGGVILVAARGLPVGIGSYVTPDRRLDARLAAAAISVPAIKGIEIGDATLAAQNQGSNVHDAILPCTDGRYRRKTNHCGGIEGGISNGEPIWFTVQMKAIPTCLCGVETVDLATGKACKTRYERSDICPVPRAVVVLESVAAYVLADALMEKLGGDSLQEQKARFTGLPRTASLQNQPHLFWS